MQGNDLDNPTCTRRVGHTMRLDGAPNNRRLLASQLAQPHASTPQQLSSILTSTHPYDFRSAYNDINVIRMDSRDLWAAALHTLKAEDRKLVAFDGQNRLDVLSDLGQLVAAAKDTSIKKRWRFHRPGSGQTVILRDLFSKIVV